MKQTLVIGSTVVDILLSVRTLPLRGEDINIMTSEVRIGGCACNVFRTMKLFESPALLCSPVGGGIYGRMVSDWFDSEGLSPLAHLEEENGCCYCLIEPDGERSFLSHHGAEYTFSRSWMKKIDYNAADSVFICGIELEEPTGADIVDFVYEKPNLALYFAPGPRIRQISPALIDRILCRRDSQGKGPLIHLNEIEALRFSNKHKLEEAAEYLTEKTENSVVITMGKHGCYCLLKAGEKGHLIPGFRAKVFDTLGAGDAHCGALLACLKKGMALEDACLTANKIGAAVVSIRGVVLDKIPD